VTKADTRFTCHRSRDVSGDTIDEALANIGEAVELYLEPVEDDWIIAKGAMVQELVV